MKQAQQQGYSEWLVIRCQLGEAEAFEQLARLWYQRLFLYAMNRLGQREAAQDVTQECLLSISRGIQALSDPAAFPRWSFRILERRCVDWLRKMLRERQALGTQAVATDQLEAVPDNLESELTVSRLLGMLDPKLAALLRLYYIENFTVEELAEIYSVPVGTIKSRLFYARKLLSQTLNK